MTADNYTGHYSAIIKVARMLVVQQAQLEVQEQEEEARRRGGHMAGPTDGVSRTKALAPHPHDGLFAAVRAKVRRFMTVVHEDGSPTPMDWIFDCRSYGLRIRYTTAVTGYLY